MIFAIVREYGVKILQILLGKWEYTVVQSRPIKTATMRCFAYSANIYTRKLCTYLEMIPNKQNSFTDFFAHWFCFSF